MTVASAQYTDVPNSVGQSHVVTAVIDGQSMMGIDLTVQTFWSEQVSAWIAAGNVPAPYVAPPPAAPTLTFLQFIALFTAAEQAAIVASADPQTKLFLIMAAGAGELQLNNAELVSGVNYLATPTTATPPGPGLIASTRPAQILADEAPPAS
jgi:hypothetical protein